MRLAAIKVENFRSIARPQQITLSDLTVFVGPNNEGKSNILRAIAVAMDRIGVDVSGELDSGRPGPRNVPRRMRRVSYSWERDYPRDQAVRDNNAETRLLAEFELSEEDAALFLEEFGVNLQSRLRIRVRIRQGDRMRPRGADDLEIVISGPSKSRLQEQMLRIRKFIGDRIAFSYIPAFRRSDTTTNLIGWMLGQRIERIAETEEYQDLTARLNDLIQPVREQLAAEICATLQEFVPEVKNVKVGGSDADPMARLSRWIQLMVDDGVETELEFKGDGIQSLAALAMLRHSSRTQLGDRHILLAVEEPEAHLHPDAIHRLSGVIRDLANEHQVLITTHSPILVDRSEKARNVIVREGRARPAQSVGAVRKSLGVKVSDNLASAELVLIVEGEEDSRVLRAWLQRDSVKLKSALRSGRLVIDELGGAGNLSYKVGLYRNLLCRVVALMDRDSAGKTAAQKAQDDGVIQLADIFLTTRGGQEVSEFEDMLRKEAYASVLEDRFGVVLVAKWFRNPKQAWSERIEKCFEMQGKNWSKKTEMNVKAEVAAVAKKAGSGALCETSLPVYTALISRIEALLGGAT